MIESSVGALLLVQFAPVPQSLFPLLVGPAQVYTFWPIAAAPRKAAQKQADAIAIRRQVFPFLGLAMCTRCGIPTPSFFPDRWQRRTHGKHHGLSCVTLVSVKFL